MQPVHMQQQQYYASSGGYYPPPLGHPMLDAGAFKRKPKRVRRNPTKPAKEVRSWRTPRAPQESSRLSPPASPALGPSPPPSVTYPLRILSRPKKLARRAIRAPPAPSPALRAKDPRATSRAQRLDRAAHSARPNDPRAACALRLASDPMAALTNPPVFVPLLPPRANSSLRAPLWMFPPPAD